jgi:ribosomal protein S18 acetylase RimI-like enzyme
MNHIASLVADYIMPSGEQIHIRPLEKRDLPGLEWDGEFAHFRKLYQQHYENSLVGNTLIWVAVDSKDEVIGQVFLLLLSRQQELADGALQAYLFSFRIKPAFRDQGLGGFMLEMVEGFLRDRGFRFLRLNVARANPLARRMYEKHGYRMIGPDPGKWRYQDQYGEWQTCHEPAWKMIKKL